MNDRERLLCVLNGKKADRPPCICPGGMMNMCTTDLMDYAHVSWPEAHTDAKMMADLAQANYESGCFDNIGVPFCMTVEAEAMGAEVTMGSREYEPRVTGYVMNSVSEWKTLKPMVLDSGRAKVVLDAIKLLKSRNLEAPIVGNVTGPISTASSVMEPVTFYKELRKKRAEAHEYMQFVTDEVIRFAKAQIEAGADLITLSDPSGTGEILGPKFFEEYAVKYINQVVDAIKEMGVPTIVHICGHMNNVFTQVNELHANALSFESCVAMKEARANLKDRILMGNISTWALEFATPDKVAALTKNSAANGADIIAPACGIGTKSPIDTIRAMKKELIAEAKGE